MTCCSFTSFTFLLCPFLILLLLIFRVEGTLFREEDEKEKDMTDVIENGCNMCTRTSSFADIISMIDVTSTTNILNLCGWTGSYIWPNDEAFHFPENDVTLIFRCCGLTCAFEGDGIFRSTELFKFFGSINLVLIEGMTFESFGIDGRSAIKMDGAGDMRFINNIVRDINLGNAFLQTAQDHGLSSQIIGNRFEEISSKQCGALRAQGGEVLAKDNKFFNLRSRDLSGGANCLFSSFARLLDNHYERNESDDNGGAIFGGVLVLESKRNKYIANTAEQQRGGAIALVDFGNCATFLYDEFRGNKNIVGSQDGGAISATSGKLVSRGSTYDGNTSTSSGGAIWTVNMCTKLEGNLFVNNEAAEDGGGVAINEGRLISKKNIYRQNRALFNGGAISSSRDSGFGRLDIYEDRFEGNSAGFSGGGVFSEGITTVLGSTFAGNAATTGAGVYCEGNVCTLKHNTFVNNEATRADGADDIDVQNAVLQVCKNFFADEADLNSFNSVIKGQCDDKRE